MRSADDAFLERNARADKWNARIFLATRCAPRTENAPETKLESEGRGDDAARARICCSQLLLYTYAIGRVRSPQYDNYCDTTVDCIVIIVKYLSRLERIGLENLSLSHKSGR